MENGRGHLDLPLSPDYAGLLACHAYTLRPDGFSGRDSRMILVQAPRELRVDVAADRDAYRPGERARLHFSVRDGNGGPTPAALGIHIVDESVFADMPRQPEQKQQCVAQAWLASLQEPAGYDWQEDSYARKHAAVAKRRERYFKRLYRAGQVPLQAGRLPWTLAEEIHRQFDGRPDQAPWRALIGVGLA